MDTVPVATSSAPVSDAIDTRHGLISYLTYDDPIGRALREFGEWAWNELSLLTSLLRPGDVVIDIGANIGTHSLSFARAVGPKGEVHAFEPQPPVLAILKGNVARNHASWVRVHGEAVGSGAGTARIMVPDYGRPHNAGAAGAAEAGYDVPVVALDALDLESCRLVKLDVEGMEPQVLAGARRTLERCRPLIYAECNSLAIGVPCWSMLDQLDYVAWLHAPHAYNPDNHRANRVDTFYGARETNLLFVPRSRLKELERLLAATPDLTPAPTIDALAAAFLELRGPVMPHAPPAVPSFDPPRPAIQRAVTVVVPVYNGVPELERLAESIAEVYPAPVEGIRWVFINDASPNPEVEKLLHEPQFDRPDFVVRRNEQNLGFICTVNSAFKAYGLGPEGTDVLLLNADTELHSPVVEDLQRVALRSPRIASVTPWSNNATLASLIDWPNGGRLPKTLSPELVSTAVRRARLEPEPYHLPTGVGFCMYVTRAALEQVGAFDERYGLGYGEENDWCQRAQSRGFTHVLDVGTFVFHAGSASFTDEVRRRQVELNLAKLHQRFPDYARQVSLHFESDPLRAARITAKWSVIQELHRQGTRVFFFGIHSDPEFPKGGTERHVAHLTSVLTEGKSAVVHFYPEAMNFRWRVWLPGEERTKPWLDELVHRDDVQALLRRIGSSVDVLHIHHLMWWPQWSMNFEELFPGSRRIITLHDYWVSCPSIRLIRAGAYCGVPAHESVCAACIVNEHGRSENVFEWRREWAGVLKHFHEILTPSEASRDVLARGFEVAGVKFRDRIRAASNFLFSGEPRPRAEHEERDAVAARRIVFLGAYAPFKGSRLFGELAPQLQQDGFALEVWGALGDALPPGVTLREYSTSEQLRSLAGRYPALVVVMPALWPETFSYTAYEALIDVRAPVVSGPFGNPQQLVRETGAGVAMETADARGLIAAIREAVRQRATLMSRAEDFLTRRPWGGAADFIAALYGAPPAQPRLDDVATGQLPLKVRPHVPRPEPVPPPAPPPLRHKIVDTMNTTVKRATPAIHLGLKRLLDKSKRKS